jgi:hypothetical protein
MPAPTRGPVRISTSRLLEQSRGRSAPVPDDPSPSRAVPLLTLGTVALLALTAALPGLGVFGPGSAPAAAAPARGQLVAESGPGTPGLPSTGGGDDGAGSGTSGSAPSTARPRVTPARTSCTAPCSTSQVVSVRILPGPLTITDAPSSVVVATDGDGRGTARLSGVRVTDLRGASAGWALSARIVRVVDAAGAPVPAARVEVVPSCTRTAGPLTLETADPSVVGVGGTASLCLVPIASSGSLAGGLVSAYADLTVSGAPAGSRVRVVVDTALG